MVRILSKENLKIEKVSRLYFIMLLLLIHATSIAQSFKATVSSNPVAVDEQFQVTFTINTKGSNFQPPSFKDFNVLSGPNQSSSIQFINGSMSQSLSYSYILVAKTEGKFKIGPANIKVNGNTIPSNIIDLTVNKAGKNSKSETDQALTKQIEDNLFIKVNPSKTTVYQGEQITVTYKLYTRLDLVDFTVSKLPTLNGFWSQDIEKLRELKVNDEVLNGVEYRSATLKKAVLFPQRSGTLLIDPVEAQSVIRIPTKRKSRSNDPWDDIFNDPFSRSYQDMDYKFKSPIVKVNVLPLPPGPAVFSGAVGAFTMESKLDKSETKSNEPVTLKIKISGKGNLKLIDPIKLQLPPDIESYDPKITDNISFDETGAHGSRTFEYLLIPRHEGNYKIPGFDFSYFNPEKKQYVNLPTSDFNLKVTKGTAVAGSVQGVNREELKLLSKDIRYIKTGKAHFRKQGTSYWGSSIFYAFLVLPIALFFGFVFYKRKLGEEENDVTSLKSKKANAVARKRLSMAGNYLKQNQKEKFYEETLKGLWGYLADKLAIPYADLSKEKISEALTKSGIEESLIQHTLRVINICEFARYAPSGNNTEMEKVYNDTIDVISKLEQGLKK